MTELVTLLLIFLAVGIGFLAVNLFVGKLLRPNRPSEEKKAIYECGEPTIGSSWIQFDLRFYVVALLFVIFDVEMAFFFPWATVFGSANTLSREDVPEVRRIEAQTAILPDQKTPAADLGEQRAAAKKLAWLAFADILFFFSVLLVGFAYLWKRGDLEWVRSTISQEPEARGSSP
ncbi:MAG: NADH-quinone oxidoreductase subunit A [Planctomycetes bacterium]|nr:NADH-quinone oxidoreductase subunit A [Planctomycetota bacterium]